MGGVIANIATAFLNELEAIAEKRGVWAISVQADYGGDPAIAPYEKLGVRIRLGADERGLPSPKAAVDPGPTSAVPISPP